jgi:hypothetical protein
MKDYPKCPECGSMAIASRFVFGEHATKPVFIGRVCKSCDHRWMEDKRD